MFRTILISALMLLGLPAAAQTPKLEQRGEATQLIVDGKPYLILGGELGNSSASHRDYLAPHWAKLKAMKLNTVLAPVSWELVEPVEEQGYRVGWIAPGRFQERVERLKFSMTIATPTLTQMAVAEYLESGGYDRHLRSLRSHFGVQCVRYREAIARAFPAGTRVSDPVGGYALWVEMPRQVNAFELQAEALERGIAIAPGPIFSARGAFTNAIRVSCTQRFSPRVEAALQTVGELAAAQIDKRARLDVA